MITEIGKIKIKWSIAASLKKEEEKLSQHYKDFLISQCNDVDINIKVKRKNFSFLYQVNPVIKAKSWQYFKYKNRIYFNFYAGQWAVIDNDFNNIYFYTKSPSLQILFYLFPELLYSLVLPRFDGILLHAAGIKFNGKIFVLLAASAGGKSTISRFALENGLKLLNDDRIILRKIKDRYFAFGNPWHGELRTTSSEYGEIKELYFLKKANKNFIKKINKKEMFAKILENSFHLKDSYNKVIEIILDMVNNLEGYTLKFRYDKSIWQYLNERFK